MDGAIKGYLERLSTEKLEAFLEDYYEDRLDSDYSYVIPYVEHILYCRKRDRID